MQRRLLNIEEDNTYDFTLISLRFLTEDIPPMYYCGKMFTKIDPRTTKNPKNASKHRRNWKFYKRFIPKK